MPSKVLNGEKIVERAMPDNGNARALISAAEASDIKLSDEHYLSLVFAGLSNPHCRHTSRPTRGLDEGFSSNVEHVLDAPDW